MAFTVTYNANGATSGTAPVDPGSPYANNATVTVLGPGGLAKTGDTFAYWNTAADGSGTVYGPGATFTITSNVTLYAEWYTTQGLTGGGITKHYAFSYDATLAASGLEPARTNSVIANAESDYAIMSNWFGGLDISSKLTSPYPIYVANLGGGAGGFNGTGAGTGGTYPNISSTLKGGNGNAAFLRYLIVSEIVEELMYVQNQGWFAPDSSNEQSCGEALSRFLAQQFLVVTGLGIEEPGYAISPSWLNSSLPTSNPSSTQLGGQLAALSGAINATATTIGVSSVPNLAFASTYIIQIDNEQMLVTSSNGGAKTLTVARAYNGTAATTHSNQTPVSLNYGSRTDYINTTLQYDHGIDAASGCAMLFLYYLNVQLGFSVKQIIAAAPGVNNAAACLRGVYGNLTQDPSDPFPFFSFLLATAFPPDIVATIPGPNADNPWPIGILQFWGEKNTWGHDEVSDLINTSNGVYPKGFWLMLSGFNRQVAGAATPATPTVAFPSTTTGLDPVGIEYESANLLVPQRIRYPYDVLFTSAALAGFPKSGEKPAAVKTSINLLGQNFAANSEFFFIAGADPYFTNVLPNPDPQAENAPYLSEDLRVFTATPGLNPAPVPGAPAFPSDSVAGAYAYVQSLISWLNQNHGDPSKPDPFDPTNNIIPTQKSALTGDSSVTPVTVSNNTTYNNYNFAVARLRLQGATPGPAGAAQKVKVFFRLWGTQTADTDWDPTYTYLSKKDSSANPLYPEAPSDNHTMPFFATGNTPNLSDPNNPEYGNNGVNNQTITIEQGDTQWAYFGCFLNLYDDSFTVNGVDVKQTYPGTHHCLVAELAYAGAPIRNAGGVVVTPETSSQLAQRNLQITHSDNPGPPSTHRIPQTFDTRLSRLAAVQTGLMSVPDELMIDWGNTPPGSIASIYWPGVFAADVLALAQRFYSIQSLSQADPHTIRCRTLNGVTYVPIPFGTGDSLAGLLTIDLPPTVVAGQQFDIVVRRVSSRQYRAAPPPPPPPPPPSLQIGSDGIRIAPAMQAVVEDLITERYVVGSFRISIPVATAATILPAEETTLAIMKARLQAMPPSNRWYPVLLRYIAYISGRVQGLGGDPNRIPPSFNGAPIGLLIGGKEEPLGHPHRYTGKIAALIFDNFGDFDGFLLDTGQHEHRFDSRERDCRDLAERVWRERLRITVITEPHEPHRVRTVLIREPPAPTRV